jgi:hypothetical protein
MAKLRQLKIWVDPGLAAAFKASCRGGGVSMAGELARFMAERAAARRPAQRAKAASRAPTRGDRRREVGRIAERLGEIRDGEDAYLGAIPENLQGGAAYEAAEHAVDSLGQAIDLLQDAF